MWCPYMHPGKLEIRNFKGTEVDMGDLTKKGRVTRRAVQRNVSRELFMIDRVRFWGMKKTLRRARASGGVKRYIYGCSSKASSTYVR